MKNTNFKDEKVQELESLSGGNPWAIRLGGHVFSRIGGRLMSTGTGKYLAGKFDLMKMTAGEAWDFFVGKVN